MPLRNFDAATQNVLEVKANVTTYWAIPEDLLFSLFYLEDLRLFNFAVLYVPIIAIIFMLIGTATRLNRRIIFMFLWGLFLLLMGSPYFVSLYDFLHQNVFFFKYFRNLHFFLWLVILPLFILFVAEQVRLFLNISTDKIMQRRIMCAVVVVAHVGLAVFLIWRESFNYATWAVIIFSLLLFILFLCQRVSPAVFCGLCLLLVAVEPIEVYHHLRKNAQGQISFSVYDQFVPNFNYTRGQKTVWFVDSKLQSTAVETRSNPLYFGTQWYNFLWDNMNFSVLNKYTFSKFILYDQVSEFDEQRENLQIVEHSWERNLNMAYVAPLSMNNIQLKTLNQKVSQDVPGPFVVEGKSERFAVLKSDVNMVRVQTEFLSDKFLVFNDGYYPGWKVYLNGQKVSLVRANVAFKGVFVPAGKQVIEFRFGEVWRYAIEIFLIIFYMIFFIRFLFLWRENNITRKEKNVKEL